MTLLLHEMLMRGPRGDPPYPDVPGLDHGEILQMVGQSTSGAATINYPAGIKKGDLVILADRAGSVTAPNPPLVMPPGFTNATSDLYTVSTNKTFQRISISYTIAPSPLGGTVTGQNGKTSNSKVMLVFRKTNGVAIKTATPRSYGIARSAGATPATLNIAAGNIPFPGVVLTLATTTVSKQLTAHTLTPGGHLVSAMAFMSVCYHSYSTPAPNLVASAQAKTAITNISGAAIAIT